MHRELTATSIADACRDVAASRATGLLRVTHPRGLGQVGFEGGRVVSAGSPAPGARIGDRLVNAGLLDAEALAGVLRDQAGTAPTERPRLGRLLVDAGLVTPDAVRLVVQEQVIDAVFELTTWERGSYDFIADGPHSTREVPLSVAVDQLLVEVARRREEWTALSRVIPDLGAIPRFREGSSASTAPLEPDEFAVLASVDGHRTIRELAEDLGYGEFEAARVIYALVLLGLVEVRRPVDEIGAALDDALAYEPPGQEDADRPPAEPVGATEPLEAAEPVEATEPLEATEPATGRSPQPPPPGRGGRPPAAAGTSEDDHEDEGPTRWAVEFEGLPQPAPPPPPDAAPPDEGPGSGPGEGSREDPDDDRAGDRSAFAELRAFTSDTPATPPAPAAPATPAASVVEPADVEPAAGPASGPAAQDASPPDDAGSTDPAATPAGPDHPPVPRPAPGGDVSEFLRELSRLALDEVDEEGPGAGPGPGEQPARPPASRPRPAPPREEPKRKRRLFGRGD
jgi:hypothetical protein